MKQGSLLDCSYNTEVFEITLIHLQGFTLVLCVGTNPQKPSAYTKNTLSLSEVKGKLQKISLKVLQRAIFD